MIFDTIESVSKRTEGMEKVYERGKDRTDIQTF